MKQIVFITGASSGIGMETARFLNTKGYKVYAGTRKLEPMVELMSMGVEVVYVDITKDEEMIAAVNHIISREGKIDVLINNAAFGLYGALEDVPLEQARYQMDVNVFGVARLVQLVLPHMRAQKSGRIINVSSVAGKVVAPYGSWYHSSKFAIEALSDSLRNEVRQFGVKIVVVEPGVIKTAFGDSAKDNLLKYSQNSVYREGVLSTAKSFDAMNRQGAKPEVISKLIFKAIKSRNPKVRYHAGYMAGPSLFARKILSDKLFDKLIQLQFRN